MAEPVSEGRIDDKCVDKESAASKTEKVRSEPKPESAAQDSSDEQEHALQHKEQCEDQSRSVNGAKEPEVVSQSHPHPEERQDNANGLTEVFSSLKS